LAEEQQNAKKIIEDLKSQIEKLTTKNESLKLSRKELEELKVTHAALKVKTESLEKEKQSLITTALNAQEDQRKLRIIVDKFYAKPEEYVKLIHENISFNAMIKGCTKQGIVKKQGGAKETKWQKRYLVLNENWLYYYASADEKEPRGVVLLRNDTVITSRCDLSRLKISHSFTIVKREKTVGRAFFFACDSEGDCNDWVRLILLASGWTKEEVNAYLSAYEGQEVSATSSKTEDAVSVVHSKGSLRGTKKEGGAKN